MAEDWALQLWARAPLAVAEVLVQALAYENAWSMTGNATTLDRWRALSQAREGLLEAIRALKEQHG